MARFLLIDLRSSAKEAAAAPAASLPYCYTCAARVAAAAAATAASIVCLAWYLPEWMSYGSHSL